MAKKIIEGEQQKGKVKIVSTGKSKDMPKGKEYEVTWQLASTLTKNGFADLK